MQRVFSLVLTIGLLCGSAPTYAQKKPKAKKHPKAKLAINDLTQVDVDFADQGEYTGVICDPVCGGRRCVGLQVVALGDGKFDAVAYRGGLPGNGWDRCNKSELSGVREAACVSLGGSQYGVALSQGQACVYSPRGRFLGRIPRIQRRSPREGALPPANAVVLFDGTNTDHFKNGKITEDGLLDVGTEIVDLFQDFTLHLEFRLPYMPYARGQGRANSGVYLQSRYEVQVLDSFGLEGAFNECAALYRTQKPDLNMCYPPLSWQTYDITFRSPRFDHSGKKTHDACISVMHNGVYVHYNRAIPNKTGAGKKESQKLLPTKLQNHSNPVRFRNIWIVDNAPQSVVPTPSNVPALPSVTRSGQQVSPSSFRFDLAGVLGLSWKDQSSLRASWRD